MAYLVTVTEDLSSAEPLTQGHFFHMQTRITTTTTITATTAAIKAASTTTTITVTSSGAVTSSGPPEGEGLVAISERIKININHKNRFSMPDILTTNTGTCFIS